MEAYIVRHSLDAVLQLQDATTGKSILERNVVFRENGKMVFFHYKGGGVYIIMNTPHVNTVYEIEAAGYEKARISVEYGESKKSYPMLEVSLIPKLTLHAEEAYGTLRGTMDGIEELEAVSLNTYTCFLQEYSAKKQQLTYYGKNELTGQEYALLHRDRKSYQRFQVRKELSRTAILTRRPLEQPYAVNDPIVRIIKGQVEEGGAYLLRYRIESKTDSYLVRYVVRGETYYQTVDAQEQERKLGE